MISMSSTFNSFKVMAACVAMVMMIMMTTMEVSAMPKHSAKTHKKSADSVLGETVSLQLDQKALVPPRHFRPLQNDSVSPWTYNVTHDASVFPPVLSEARCLLSGCLDSEGREDLSLESRPIMHQVLQLRRVRAGDNYHYRLEARLVAVGCTCVRPMVKVQI